MAGVAGNVEKKLIQAQEYKYEHRYQDAIQVLRSALASTPSFELSLVRRSEILREIIECLYNRGEYSSAMKELEKARRRLSPQVKTLSLELGRLHSLAAGIHLQMGSNSEAMIECRKALEMFESQDNEQEASTIHKYMGHLSLVAGNVTKSLHHFSKSLNTVRRIGDEIEAASVLNNMAHLYFITADWVKALGMLEEALHLAEKHEVVRLIGRITNNLGFVHQHLGNLDLAEKCYERSLHIFVIMGNNLASARGYLSLGYIAHVRRELLKAERLYGRARSLAEEQGFQRERSLSYEYLGELFVDTGRFEEAESLYKQALKVARSIAPGGDLVHSVYRKYAELKILIGEPRKALSLSRSSWEISLKLRDRFEEGVVFRVFGMAHSLLGDRRKAREYFDRSIKSLATIGEKYEKARTLLAAGHFFLESDPDPAGKMEARVYLIRAHDLFMELDLTYWLKLTASELDLADH